MLSARWAPAPAHGRLPLQDCALWRLQWRREFGEPGALQVSPPGTLGAAITAPRCLVLATNRGGHCTRAPLHASCPASGGCCGAGPRLEAPVCGALRRAAWVAPLDQAFGVRGGSRRWEAAGCAIRRRHLQTAVAYGGCGRCKGPVWPLRRSSSMHCMPRPTCSKCAGGAAAGPRHCQRFCRGHGGRGGG